MAGEGPIHLNDVLWEALQNFLDKGKRFKHDDYNLKIEDGDILLTRAHDHGGPHDDIEWRPVTESYEGGVSANGIIIPEGEPDHPSVLKLVVSHYWGK